MKIIITGSSGHISLPLTKELVGKGHEVTVISSNPDRQNDIEALGATPAIGSVDDVTFLEDTFTGADAVYCMIPPNFYATDQIAYYKKTAYNYAQSIKHSGIKRVVHLSSYGADLDKGTGFILGAHYAEGIFDELPGITLTHLRPGYFYYNLYNFTDMIKDAGFIGANYGGDDKIVLVAPVDIAAAAAEELTTAATERNIRYVASDDRTAAGIAQALGAVIGKTDLQWLTFTNEQMQQGMEQRQAPTHVITNFVELGAAIHSGILRKDYDQHKPPMGKVKLEDFAKEFAAVYNQK